MKKTALLLFCLIIFPIGIAHAHKVIVFAWVENGTIYTESSFGSKRPAKDSPIIVKDHHGKIVAEGRTDEKGLCRFNVPDNIDSDLKVMLEAGTGHKGSWTILKQELEQGNGLSNKTAGTKKAAQQGPSPVKILGGIGVIMLLALLGRQFLKKRSLRG